VRRRPRSRNDWPLSRYFPELASPVGRYVLDGEIVVRDDGGVAFGALQHGSTRPPARRAHELETPASVVASTRWHR
jgi:ATP-dependent DNA ligase